MQGNFLRPYQFQLQLGPPLFIYISSLTLICLASFLMWSLIATRQASYDNPFLIINFHFVLSVKKNGR